MDAASNLLAVAAVSLLAAVSPGPDFCIVVRNSLSYSRKAGFWTAFGVSLALVVHLYIAWTWGSDCGKPPLIHVDQIYRSGIPILHRSNRFDLLIQKVPCIGPLMFQISCSNIILNSIDAGVFDKFIES